RFVDTLRLFKRAVSWGGYESLIFPSAVKGGNSGNAAFDDISLIRLHVGLEAAEDLIEDLDNALQRISN
ncbi:MAG: PLP-dependent transferase, partial [Treponema sp.]|nr:PLP-dependent transferase [Treponema sp.]